MTEPLTTQDEPVNEWWIEGEVKRRLIDQGARIREARRRTGWTIEELSRRVAMHSNTVGRIERGTSEATAEQQLRLAGALGVSPESLSAFPQVINAVHDSSHEFALINEIDARVSAGNGSDNNQPQEVIGRFAFSREWLQKRRLRPHDCCIIRARGKSMADRINDGDILLVDQSIRTMGEDGVYVIERDGLDYVKLLQKDFVSGGVHIISYNPDFPAQFVEGRHADELRISGRVVWHGGDT